MAEIRLSNGCVALLDDEDLPRVQHLKWRGQTTIAGVVYVFSAKRSQGGSDVVTLLHRLIMDAPEGVFVDHVNGDPLDNRRCNLRFATRAQNAWNRRRRIPNQAGYVGVSRKVMKGLVRWEARLQANGRIFCRICKTDIEAALARDEMAREHHGDFAVLNFPSAGAA